MSPVALLAVLTMSTLLAAGGPPQESFAKLRAACVEAIGNGEEGALQFFGHWRKLASRPEWVQALRHDKDPSLALRASWTEVVADLPAEIGVLRIALPKQKLTRFAGLLEGRLGVPIPKEWERTLMKLKGDSRTWIVGPESGAAGLLRHNCPLYLVNPGVEVTVDERTSAYRLTHGERTVVLPDEVIRNLNEYRILTATVAEKHFFIAVYNHNPNSYKLYCVAQDGSLSWTTTVWGEGGGAAIRPAYGSHGVILVVHKEMVFVFGIHPLALYVEGFTAHSGTAVVRFNTNYGQ